jgi:membrane protein implicated in regulation of membrane protease activity
VGAVIAQIILFVVMAGTVIFLVGAMVRSIQNEKKRSGIRKTFSNFGLSIVLVILFFTSWVAQGIAEWQTFVDEQRAHQEPVAVGNFIAQFAQSTLENWQSEFLQLFSFVVLAALYLHRGSAESRDSDDRMEEALKRIEAKLGTKS